MTIDIDFLRYITSDIIMEQFAFSNNNISCIYSLKCVAHMFFKKFQKKNIGLLICNLLIFEQITKNKLLIKVTKYRIRREKRISLIFRCSFNVIDMLSDIISKVQLKYIGIKSFNIDYNRLSNIFTFKLDKLVTLSEMIINSRIFIKYFEFANQFITFSIYNSFLKDLFFLRICLSYLGLLLL